MQFALLKDGYVRWAGEAGGTGTGGRWKNGGGVSQRFARRILTGVLRTGAADVLYLYLYLYVFGACSVSLWHLYTF